MTKWKWLVIRARYKLGRVAVIFLLEMMLALGSVIFPEYSQEIVMIGVSYAVWCGVARVEKVLRESDVPMVIEDETKKDTNGTGIPEVSPTSSGNEDDE